MERLCERPGCSDAASVAYGLRPEALVFWLDNIDGPLGEGGVLCLRHADTMIVPRGWTLDDLRDPDLHLFRPPAAEPVQPRVRRAVVSASGETPDPAEQLELGDVNADAVNNADPAEDTDAADLTGADQGASAAVGSVDASARSESWSPSFDSGDDLDGLLSASRPLLARAFRGDDRPRA